MRRYLLWLPLLLLIVAFGCKKTELDYAGEDKSAPKVTLLETELHWVQEKDLYVKGQIADDIGIKAINIKIADWSLDKTITFEDSLVKSYDLSYKFKVPADAVDKQNIIEVTVTDVSGKTAKTQMSVYMDGDFTAPTFAAAPDAALTLVMSPKTQFKLTLDVADNKNLSYVVIKSDATLNYYDSVSVSGLTATIDRVISLPSEVGEYSFTYTLADKAGNKVARSTSLKVSELPDFEKMYLADVETKEALNSDLFGVPMRIEHTGAFAYTANYYSAKAGTKVRFIPQKTDFQPNCFGLDDTKTMIINDPNSTPLTLPEVGYYQIDFNIKTGVYSVKKYTPTDATPNSLTFDLEGTPYPVKLGLVGKGMVNYPDQDWDTSKAILLKQSAENKYIYSVDIDLQGTVEFIISPEHPWGWWPDPFWRFDSWEEPEVAVPQGGDNYWIEIQTKSSYTFIFDSHLNRAKLIKR